MPLFAQGVVPGCTDWESCFGVKPQAQRHQRRAIRTVPLNPKPEASGDQYA